MPRTIRSSSKWLVGSNISSQVLQFIFGIVLARLLVPADFGMIVTIQIFTGLVGMFASAGMGQALIRAKEVDERDFQVVFSIQLGIGLLIYAAFFAIAPWFADWFGHPLYRDLLRVSSISFLIRPFVNMHNIWLQREMRFQETSIRNLAISLASGLVSVIMAASGFGVWSLLAGGLAGSALAYLMVFRLTPLHARLHFNPDIAHRHSQFGFKITLNDLISYLRRQTSNLIIAKLAGASLVGLFNKGDSLAKLPFTTISDPIYQPVFRTMSAAQDNPDKIKYLYFKMVSMLILYTLPFYVGLWWLAKPFIIVVYGQHWADAAVPLTILAPVGFLYCIGHPCGAVLAATNRVGREVWVQLVTWIIVALGCYFGLHWGLAGVAYGIVLSQLYSTVHMYVLANQCYRARPRDLVAAIWPGTLLNTVLVAALLAIDWALPAQMRQSSAAAYLLISAAGGALAYGLAFLFLPLPSLADESLRWKRLLRLAPRYQ